MVCIALGLGPRPPVLRAHWVPVLAPRSFCHHAEACGLALSPSIWASLVAQSVKNLPAVQETQVRSLDREDPLKKGMVTHPRILGWRIPWTVHGVAKSWTQLNVQNTGCAKVFKFN